MLTLHHELYWLRVSSRASITRHLDDHGWDPGGLILSCSPSNCQTDHRVVLVVFAYSFFLFRLIFFY